MAVATPPPPAPVVEASPATPTPQEEPATPEPVTAAVPAPALTPSPTGPTPPPSGEGEATFRVLFDAASAKISESSRAPLEELSNTLKESDDLRVQLLAYASGTAETASQARRLSLSRALAVRSFLIDQGVRSTRMDVRALGNKGEGGPEDRVDAVLVGR